MTKARAFRIVHEELRACGVVCPVMMCRRETKGMLGTALSRAERGTAVAGHYKMSRKSIENFWRKAGKVPPKDARFYCDRWAVQISFWLWRYAPEYELRYSVIHEATHHHLRPRSRGWKRCEQDRHGPRFRRHFRKLYRRRYEQLKKQGIWMPSYKFDAC